MKKTIAVIMAVVCLLTSINITWTLSASEDEAVTVTEDFSGGKINQTDYLAWMSLPETVATPESSNFALKDDSTEDYYFQTKVSAGANVTNYLEVSTIAGEQKLLTVSGEIHASDIDKQWGFVYKKDASGTYKGVMLRSFNSKTGGAYLAELSAGADATAWTSTNLSSAVAGTSQWTQEDYLGQWIQFEMSYDYESKDVTLKLLNGENVLLEYTVELATTDSMACALVGWSKTGQAAKTVKVDNLIMNYGTVNSEEEETQSGGEIVCDQTVDFSSSSLLEDKTIEKDILAIYSALGITTATTPVYSVDGALKINAYSTGNNTASTAVTTDSYTFKASGGGYNGLTALIGLKENTGYIDKMEFTCNLSAVAHQATMLVTSYTNESIFDGVAISGAAQLRYYNRTLSNDTVTIYQGGDLVVYNDKECTEPATKSLAQGTGTVTLELTAEDGVQYYLVTISDGTNAHYFKREIASMLQNFYLGTVRYNTTISSLKYHVFEGPKDLDFNTLDRDELSKWEVLYEAYPEFFTDEQAQELKTSLSEMKIKLFTEAVDGLPTIPEEPTDAELAELLVILTDMEKEWNALSEDEKNSVTNKDTYLAFKEQVEQLLEIKNAQEGIENGGLITFEYGDTSMVQILNGNSSSTSEITENPLKDEINSSDYVISFAHATNDSAVLALDEAFVSGDNALKAFRTKVYVDKSSHPVIIYNYVDAQNWRGLCLTWNGSELKCYQAEMKSGTLNHRLGTALATHQPIVKESHSMGSEDAMWLDVVFNYNITTVEIEFNSADGLARFGGYHATMASSYATRVALGTHNTSNAAYFDDISYTFIGTTATTIAQNFEEDYDELLRLRAATVSNIDKEELDAATAEYAELEAEVQYALPLVDVQLEELTEAYNNKHSDNTADLEKAEAYWENEASEYIVTDDFETTDSLGKYVDVDTGEMADKWGKYYFGASPRIEYSEAMGSNALWIDDTQLTIKEDLLPDKAVHTKVEYDFCIDARETTRQFYWPGIRINTVNNSFGMLQCNVKQQNYEKRGDLYYCYQPRTDYWQQSMLDPYQPMHVEILVDDTNWTITVSQEYEGEEYEYVWTVKDSAANRMFYLGLQGQAGFYDNLSITYIEGDFDVDVEIDYITVLYSGNTVVDGGDVVTLEGENLSANVSKIEVQEVANSFQAANHSYVELQNWITAGVPDGTYSKDKVSPTWDVASLSTTEVPILQKTIESVKFALPSDFKDGIYAVKLYGFENDSEEDDVVIYLNAPYMEYTYGDEGDTALAGGTVQIVGKNLVPYSDEVADRTEKPRVYILMGDEFRELTISEIKSDYSLVVDVPLDVEVGETYEIWLYNGYGDDTCWSVPTTITIGTDIRESWKHTFINIQDETYGATGIANQNATPIFIRALEALYQAGGGTLYLPEGVYRLTQPLIIPENVIITGESRENTNILYTAHRWGENDLPDYVLKLQGNCEISNISFYAGRIGGFIQINCETDDNVVAEEKLYTENIYIDNIKTHFNPYANSVTGGGTDGSNQLISSTDAWVTARTETVGSIVSKNDMYLAPTKNVHITNSELATYGQQTVLFMEWAGAGLNYYWQIENVDMRSGNCWSPCGLAYSVAENVSNTTGGVTFIGNSLYVDGMDFSNNVDNNRELSIADLHSARYGTGMKLVEGTECTYEISGTNNKLYHWYNCSLAIVEGNGAGQYREIVDVKLVDEDTNTWHITLKEPYYVKPNRNSTFHLRYPRKSTYYVDSYLSNGAAGFGYYGGFVDVVNDGNTFANVGGQYVESQGTDVNWYYSYVNNTNAYDPYFFHTSVLSSYMKILTTMNPIVAASKGFTIRDNDFGGYYININATGEGSIRDVVIQDNWFEGSEYMVSFSNSPTKCDGIYIGSNYCTDVDTRYSPYVLEGLSTIDDIGQKIVAIDDDMTPTTLKGDVNCDGVVNIKDVTYVRYYVIGKIELTEEQLENGDMDEDGELTILDAVLIRNQVLEAM